MTGHGSSRPRGTDMTAKLDKTRQATRGLILVVEDEADLQELLRYNLEREGFAVTAALTGEKALALAQSEKPDLVLLDLMLPGVDGLTVCRQLRADPNTSSMPVIMLTAKGEEADVVIGLELGADDYVTKPFSPRLLLARIRAVLRRNQQAPDTRSADQKVIRHGPLVIDPDKHEVTLNGETLELTAGEFRVLRLLVGRPDRVFTRQQIIEAVHGPKVVVTDRSVDVQVVSLRRKLGEIREQLKTVRGVGYRFSAENSD